MKESISRKIESQKSYFNRAKKAEEDLQKELQEKKNYYVENKEFGELEDSSALKRKYNNEIEDFDQRIHFNKNTLQYTIQDAIKSIDEINKEIEPYIAVKEMMANVNVNLHNQQIGKLEQEIQELEKQRDLYPEYNKLYTQEGKEEFARIEANIQSKTKEISDLRDEISMYQDRENLMKQFKENLTIKKACIKTAEKY